MASMKVVLPAPLGPMSPTMVALGHLEPHVDERLHAAEAHRHALGPQRRRHDSLAVPAIADCCPPGAGVSPGLAAAASFCCFFW